MNIVVFLLLQVFSANLQIVPPDLQTFLKNQVNFSQEDMQALEKRAVLTKQLDTGDRPEVAIFGVMHLEVPVDFFVDKYRDIETFMKSSQVVEIGRFHNPPHLNDLRGLSLDPKEVLAIKECEVGNCNMKLPASVIERFKKEVDWSMPDYQVRATELVKEMMVDYVSAYLVGGNAAMGQYDDQKYPLRVADEFHELLQESNYLYEYVPELYHYLEAYPQVQLPGLENIIYWSKTKFDKLRPIVSINHVTLLRRSEGKAKTLIGSRQIYANHYFEASFELTALVAEGGGNEKSSFFLLYFNRSRFDTLRKSAPSAMKRTIRRETLSKVDQEMKSMKAQIETLYHQENVPTRESNNID